MTSRDETVFISWIAFHGRSEGLAKHLGIRSVYFDGGEGNIITRYRKQWRETVSYLRAEQPRQVVVMQPPVVALLAARFALKGKKLRIVGDLHTGAFVDPKWAWSLPLGLRLIRREGVVVVTNESLARRVRAKRYPTHVVHDLIEVVETAPASEKYVLVPLAYAHDEPLKELLSAAEMHPEIEWRLTGRAPQWVKGAAPSNVKFLGFLSNEEYWEQFSRAGVIAALTTEEDTMQRAGYEALSFGKALMTSDTRVLREFFQDSAMYAQPTARGIADAAAKVTTSIAEWEFRIRAQRDVQVREQLASLAGLGRDLFGEGEAK